MATGGKWVSDPIRQQTVWVPTTPGARPQHRRSSRRTSPSPQTSPAPQTYTSDLLQQSFTSEQARTTAEAQFRQQSPTPQSQAPTPQAQTTAQQLTVNVAPTGQTARDTSRGFLQSRWEATKQSARNLFRYTPESREDKIARARTITDTTSGPKLDEPNFWQYVIAPFQYTNKRGEESTGMMKEGTIGPDESPFYSGFEMEDKFVQTPEINIAVKHQEFQQRVNEGKIDIEKANQEFLDSIKGDQKKIDTATRGSGKLYSAPSYEFAQNLPSYAETGLVIGASAVNPVLASGYLLGTGLWKSDRLNQRVAQGYTPTFAEKSDVAFRLAFGASTVIGAPIRFNQKWVAQNLREGMSAPSFTRTNLFTMDATGRKGSQIITRQTANYDEFTKISFDMIKKGDGFVIGGASGKTTYRVVDPLKHMRNRGMGDGFVSTTRDFLLLDNQLLKGTIQAFPNVQATAISNRLFFKGSDSSVRNFGASLQDVSRQGVTFNAPITDFTFFQSGRKTASAPFRDFMRNIGITRDRSLSGASLIDDAFKTGGTGTSFGSGGGQRTIQGFKITQTSGTPSIPQIVNIAPQVQAQSPAIPQFTFSSSQVTTQQPRSSSMQVSLQVPALTSAQIPQQTTQTRTEQLMFTPPRTTQQPRSSSRQGNLLFTTPKIDSSSTTDLILKPVISTTPAFFSPPVSPSIRPPIGGGGGFNFPIPKFFGTDAGGGLRKFKATRTYKYTPSIGALVTGTPFKVGRTSTRRFTGLEFRGVEGKKKKGEDDLFQGFLQPKPKPKRKKRSKEK